MSPAPVSAERLKHLLDNPEHINPRYELSAIITLALEALALRTPPDGEVVACAQFLIDRLDDFERGSLSDDIEDACRDFDGHVSPAIERLRSALTGKE